MAPIRFVHQTLFPFARERLDAFLVRRGGDPVVGSVLARVPGDDKLRTLLGWMDRDAKEEPLKTLQGMIWAEGCRDGSLRGELYPEVGRTLRAWRAGGVHLAVYLSGSEEAQRRLFGHSDDGDLVELFDRFFDTRVGPKRELASYERIAATLGDEPGSILFLPDVAAELDAARTTGLLACQVVRPDDGTPASDAHETATDLLRVSLLFDLPVGT